MRLDGIYADLARVVGEDNAKAIAREFGGQYIYFCKVERLERAERDEAIRQEFNGLNHRELSKKYNLSTQRIRDIVAVKGGTPAVAKPKPKVLEQANLLDLPHE